MAKAVPARLLKEIRACTFCQDEGILPAANPILQVPDDPVVAVFGQAPGNLAHERGLPFKDPSGDRLRDWMGVDEEIFYHSGRIAIVPMAFCFPGYDGSGKTGKGGDLPPPKVCAERWRDQIMKTLLPKLSTILLVGNYAQKWHLGDRMAKSLTDTVHLWPDRFAEAEEAGQLLLPLPHPSWRNTGWLKKNPWFEAEVLPRLQARINAALK